MDFKKSCLSSSLNSNYTRSENWYGFKRPGLKTGVENYIFLSEIGSGFGEAGDTPPPKILKTPPRRGTLDFTLGGYVPLGWNP